MATATQPTRWYHSDDYRELIGELQFNPNTGMWQLQYVAPGTVDRLGGLVTLQGIAPDVAKGLQPGMVVAVRGSVGTAVRGTSPDFQVAEFDAMTR